MKSKKRFKFTHNSIKKKKRQTHARTVELCKQFVATYMWYSLTYTLCVLFLTLYFTILFIAYTHMSSNFRSKFSLINLNSNKFKIHSENQEIEFSIYTTANLHSSDAIFKLNPNPSNSFLLDLSNFIFLILALPWQNIMSASKAECSTSLDDLAIKKEIFRDVGQKASTATDFSFLTPIGTAKEVQNKINSRKRNKSACSPTEIQVDEKPKKTKNHSKKSSSSSSSKDPWKGPYKQKLQALNNR